MMLTQARLRELLDYDPERGVFTPLYKRSGRRLAEIVGTVADDGYRLIWVGKRRYKFHRLVWFWMYGEWPSQHTDHINGDKGDNRLCNLRVVPAGQNIQNSRLKITNTSGYKGVSWKKESKKWQARIQVNSKSLYLGYYQGGEEAARAYDVAAIKHFGPLAKTNQALGLLP